MKKADYLRYLDSSQWKERASKVKQKNHDTCEICENQIMKAIQIMKYEEIAMYYYSIPNLVRFIETFEEWKGKSANFIVAHHKTYERIGNEKESDLAAVCVACHVVITENTPQYRLEKAWDITCDYMADVIQQIKIANKAILANAKVEKEIEKLESANTSYSWLLPPKK